MDKALGKYVAAQEIAKCAEFAIPKSVKLYNAQSDDLCFNAMYTLSEAASWYICSDDTAELPTTVQKQLQVAASFYDAATKDTDHKPYTDGFWVLAMSTYFLSGNFGSAAVAARHIQNFSFYGSYCEKAVQLVQYLTWPEHPTVTGLNNFVQYVEGSDIQIRDVVSEAASLLNFDDPEDHLFGKICYSFIKIALKYSARNILPNASGIPVSEWMPYLASKNACLILWEAQKLIADSGAFSGKSIFVQLPTGTGKTRSIELLIRSLSLSHKIRRVAIIAPLRALCSQISDELRLSASDFAVVNQSSDVLEVDQWINSTTDQKTNIMIFTPEKFEYVQRHTADLAQSIDLFVFDEASLIYDPSRGAKYELLIATIKRINPSAQIVLLSAVAEDAQRISKWATGNDNSFVSGDLLPRTAKMLGKWDNQNIDFCEENLSRQNIVDGERHFSVNPQIHIQKLQGNGRRKNTIQFPELIGSSKNKAIKSRDIALYFSNILVRNGGVAIFIPQARSIFAFFKRLKKLYNHNVSLPNLQYSCSQSETQAEATRIKSLIEQHYGPDNPFSSGIDMGILPHYGSFQGALRQVVEYDMQKGYFKCVACTSTLGQGVNLPIKYLMITGVRQGSNRQLSYSDFQNLIGRAVRASIYSEGSVIITDASNFHENYSRYIASTNDVHDYTAISRMLSDYIFSNGKFVSSLEILDTICHAMSISPITVQDDLRSLFRAQRLNDGEIESAVNNIFQVLVSIESYIADALAQDGTAFDVQDLCERTFSYSLLNSQQKGLLLRLFSQITAVISNQQESTKAIYAKTGTGFVLANQIIDWLSIHKTALVKSEEDSERLHLVCEAYFQLNSKHSIWSSVVQLERAAYEWMNKANILEILQCINESSSGDRSYNIQRIERVVDQDISYNFANFVSCLDDVLVTQYKDVEDIDAYLQLLHAELKFGVPSLTACTICQQIFDDRVVASAVADILGDNNLDTNTKLSGFIAAHMGEITEYFNTLPEYYRTTFEFWKQNN